MNSMRPAAVLFSGTAKDEQEGTEIPVRVVRSAGGFLVVEVALLTDAMGEPSWEAVNGSGEDLRVQAGFHALAAALDYRSRNDGINLDELLTRAWSVVRIVARAAATIEADASLIDLGIQVNGLRWALQAVDSSAGELAEFRKVMEPHAEEYGSTPSALQDLLSDLHFLKGRDDEKFVRKVARLAELAAMNEWTPAETADLHSLAEDLKHLCAADLKARRP